jgi:hypothetical protein
MLWLDVPRTLLLKPALGKAKRHAMHNPKITMRSISDIKNIQINDDATTTRSAKVSEVKERTVLKCTFTGTHRSQRQYLSFCLINMMNYIHKRQPYTELVME